MMKKILTIVCLLTFPLSLCAQKVQIENGIPVIDCSSMAPGSVKTPEEVAQTIVAAQGITNRHWVSDANGWGLPVNVTVSPKFTIALADLAGTFDWAAASGWAYEANDSRGPTYNTPVADPVTGCKAYRGPNGSDPIGSWRLPTQREWGIIWMLRADLYKVPGFTPLVIHYYWSSTENHGTTAWVLSLETDSIHADDRIIERYVRCIRDL